MPHAEEYRQHYNVSIDDVLLILNEPEEQEGLASDKFTAARVFESSRVFLDYYVTLPLQGEGEMVCAIVDYVGSEPLEHLPN